MFHPHMALPPARPRGEPPQNAGHPEKGCPAFFIYDHAMQLDQLAAHLAPPKPDARLLITNDVRRELTTFDEPFSKTRQGKRFMQQLLSIRGFATDDDGDKGPATNRQLAAFKRSVGLADNPVYDRETHEALVYPIVEACALPSAHAGRRSALVAAAEAHAAARAREITPNRGPWVRLYMSGNEGRVWPWCAGFVSFVLVQAAAAFGEAAISQARAYRTFSCDVLAKRAKQDGRFIEGADVYADRAAITPGDVFLIQRHASDWTHTGIVSAVHGDGSYSTIEGNTNAGGGREGLYVLPRVRRIPNRRSSGVDFIRCPIATAAEAQP